MKVFDTNFKAFTLVEMLIVIVIIGILIAALMPRLQGAQGRARDVARQADLAQIQTAIINYQTQRGYYPWGSGSDKTNLSTSSNGNNATGVSLITTKLTTLGGLNGVPNDPNLSNEVTGLKGATDSTNSIKSGNYAYLVMDKNSITNNGFVLMARVETEGGANWVYDKDSTDNTGKRVIGDNINDISNIHLCTNFSDSGAENKATNDDAGNCSYGSVSQLRYVLAF